MADAICPTFAAGTISLFGADDILNDSALAGSANGYQNQNAYHMTVGSFNNRWNNGCLTQSVTPTFSTSLVDFGATGRQS